MSILNRRHYQRGVGLIEVLIALVVIGVGFIAIMGLQGTLMSGSATTKARNEAVVLAREKIEVLRNAIERDQFDTDLAVVVVGEEPVYIYDPDYKDGIKVNDDSGNGKINGVNAQFTRKWKIVDFDRPGFERFGAENARELIMHVAWTDAQGSDNQVELNTIITFASPSTSTLSGSTDGSLHPGGTDTGYEGLHGETPGDEYIDSEYTPDEGGLEDRLGITRILRYSNSGHVQVRIPDPLCPGIDSDSTDCTCPIVDRVIGRGETAVECVVFTAFGGTLLRFGGTVFVENYLSNKTGVTFDATMRIKATSPAYCAHKEEGAGSVCDEIDSKEKINCVEYLCYASGDCTDTTAGVNGCPTESEAVAALPDLNGGWYGKIGYYFPLENSSNFPTICMGKYETVDDAGNPILDDDGNPVLANNQEAARSYYSLRNDGSKDWREGINQSFLGHNTLIVDTTSVSEKVCDADGYEKMITAGIVWNSFVGPKKIRTVTGDNAVLGTDETYEDIVAIYGSIIEFPEHPPLLDNETLVNSGSSTFESLETVSTGIYADSVDGKCVTQEDNKGIIYACNYVNTQWADGWTWSGSIIAEVRMSFTITTDIGELTEESRVCDNCLCTVTNNYDSYSSQPPNNRYPGEDIPKEDSVILCETSPIAQ